MAVKETAQDVVQRARSVDPGAERKEYVTLLTRAMEIDPYCLDPYIMLGFLYFKERDWENALSNLMKSTQLDHLVGNDEEIAKKVYITLGKVHQIVGNIEKSLTSFKALIGLFPDSKASEKLLKDIYSKLENRDEWFGLFKAGYNCYATSNYQDTLLFLKKSFGITSNFSWAYYYNARALLALERPQRAVSSLARALELDDHFLFYYALYEAHDLMKEDEKALGNLRKALSINPFCSNVMLNKCEEHIKEKRAEKAETIVHLVLQSPDIPEVTNQRAQKLLSRLRPGHAETKGAGSKAEEPAALVESKDEPVLREMKKKVEEIYYDHVVGAEAEVEKITWKAREEAQRMLDEARNEAENIISEAQGMTALGDREYLHKLGIQADEEKEELLKKAREEAWEIVRDARKEAEVIIADAQGSKDELEVERKRLEEEGKLLLDRAKLQAEEIVEAARQEIEEERMRLAVEEKKLTSLRETSRKAEEIGKARERDVLTAESLRNILRDESERIVMALRICMEDEFKKLRHLQDDRREQRALPVKETGQTQEKKMEPAQEKGRESVPGKKSEPLQDKKSEAMSEKKAESAQKMTGSIQSKEEESDTGDDESRETSLKRRRLKTRLLRNE